MSKLEHVWRFVTRTPWAILPEKFEEILALLELHESGLRLSSEEIKARVGDAPRRMAQVSGRIGVLPVYGTIVPRASVLSDFSGGVSAEQLAREVRGMVADSGVDSIVLDINSPGGSITGLPELAAEIRAARDVKPVYAIGNPTAASAAYWIGAQATDFSMMPSGRVGSIGVFAAHEDRSQAEANAGRKVTLISAGKYKVEANPFEPLSDEARAAIAQDIDTAYGWFVADVARGRGVSEDLVRSGFGEGRMVFSDRALAERMVDRVETFDELVGRIQGTPNTRKTAFAASAGAGTAPTSDGAGQVPANVAAVLRLIEQEVGPR